MSPLSIGDGAVMTMMIVIVIGVAIVIGGTRVIRVTAAMTAVSVLNVGGGELGSIAAASGTTVAKLNIS